MTRDTTVLLNEKRIFKPDAETVERANVKDWETEIEKEKILNNIGLKKQNNFIGLKMGHCTWW